MFIHQGVWLPDGEKHIPQWMDASREIIDGRGTYQIGKWRSCLPWIKNWRRAIDVGSHVGLWSMQMTKRFRRVDAFEPVDSVRECFNRNLGEDERAVVHAVALGSHDGAVAMRYCPEGSGNSFVSMETSIPYEESSRAQFPFRLTTLDSFGWFEEIDFIKIDCEGYEHLVIEGARETLERCRPCIIVEQKPYEAGANYPRASATPAVDLLRNMGAKMRDLIKGDYILSFDT